VGNVCEDREKYIVVMLHPVTTQISSAKKQTEEVLRAVESLSCQIYWFWPNVDAGSELVSNVIRHHREAELTRNIYFIKNLKPEDFLKLLYNSVCIVGNSSVGIRECSYLGVPAVNIGDRQKGRDRGRNVIDVEEYDSGKILSAIQYAKSMPHYSDLIYGDGNAGRKIAEVIKKLDNISIDKRITY
jgi:UDP-hydrolysing UDP-N-acetyl-D-glucosamine 2-epimerase